MHVDPVNIINTSNTSKEKHTKIKMIDKTKRLLWNIFSSGLPTDYDLEALRKILLLNLMFFLGSFFLILLGAIEFFLQDFLLSIVDLSFFLLLLGFFFYMRKTRNHQSISLIGTAIAGFFFFFLIAYGGIGHTAYMWAFTYPLISIFLLGTRKGSIFSLILLTMACIVFAFGENVEFFATYNVFLKLRFVPTFITISLLAFVMEKTREIFRNRLETAKLDIEKTVEKLEVTNEALMESENQYRQIFESIQDVYYRTKLNGEILSISPSIKDVGGYHHEELIGQSVQEFYRDPTERDKFAEAMMVSGQVDNFEVALKAKDGRDVTCSLSGRLVDGTDGEPVGFAGVIRDITEHKQAEEKLRESEEKYRTFFNTSRDCVYISSMDGRLLDINDASVELFGYDSREELQKASILDFYEKPEDRENFINIMSKQGFTREHPVNLRKKNGRIINTLVTAVPKKDEGGNIIGFQGTVRDISEKKAMEEQLRQAQKMEAIGTLAGGVAHDLNNILSGIVGYPDLLLLQLPEESPLRKPILTIQESGLKAAAIVRDLLTLARRGVATYEVLSLNDIISGYLESPEYEKMKSFYPDVEVETNFEAGLLNILGSPIHILKVVMNLVSNSAEAIGAEGMISISTTNRYIDRPIVGYENVEEGDYVILTVSDSGSGISSEDMKRIFEPFYTKKKMGKSGTGLGMAVVWGTVKDHKGFIDVQSTEGSGTTFTLYFPVTRQEPAKNKVGLPIDDYMGRGQSVLVVDDMKEQRELLSAMLKTLGYLVTTASSGEEAAGYFQNNSSDLLILDMIMTPGMDGLDTYRQILKFHPEQKAIIASGYSETDRVKEAQRLGAGKYIKKPYTLEKIGIAVKEELEK